MFYRLRNGLLLAAVICTAMAGTAASEAYETDMVTVVAEPAVDLSKHVLAHVDAGSVLHCNYDGSYVAAMEQRRREANREGPLAVDLDPFAEALQRHEGLWNLSTAAAFFSDPEVYLGVLEYWSGERGPVDGLDPMQEQAAEGMAQAFAEVPQGAIHSFAEAARTEYESFYGQYWEDTAPERRSQKELFWELWNDSDREDLERFFQNRGLRRAKIYLSEAMRRGGRGFMDAEPGRMGGIVPLPETENAFPSYAAAVRELLHAVIDPLVADAADAPPGDRVEDPETGETLDRQQVLRNAVIVFQYWLLENISDDKGSQYLQLMHADDAEQLQDNHPLPREALARLEQIRDAIWDNG